MNRIVLGMIASLLALPATSHAEKFIQSDDYKEGDEVVGKFLVDADYQRMVDDVERHDEEFDWVYIAAEGRPTSPKALKFALQGKKVFVAEVQNFAGLVAKNLPPAIAENFGEAFKVLGATLVTEAAGADYELGIAIVDADPEGGGWAPYVGRIDPFVELEIRLRDLAGQQDLLLIRNQAHSRDIDSAVLKFADDLSKFLR